MSSVTDVIAKLQQRHGKLIASVEQRLRVEFDDEQLGSLVALAQTEGANARFRWEEDQKKEAYRWFLTTYKKDVAQELHVELNSITKWLSEDRGIPPKYIPKLQAMAAARGVTVTVPSISPEIFAEISHAAEVACIGRHLPVPALTEQRDDDRKIQWRAVMTALTDDRFVTYVQFNPAGLVRGQVFEWSGKQPQPALDQLAWDLIQTLPSTHHRMGLQDCGFKFLAVCREWSGPILAWAAATWAEKSASAKPQTDTKTHHRRPK